MKKVVEVFIVIILFIAIGFGGWYLYNSIQKERNRVNELENKLVNIETARNLNTEEKNDKSNNIDNNKLNNVDNENKNSEKNIQEKIIGKWSIERIFDSVTGEEMGYSQFFGLEIAEKYHFEFYEDGTYIMQLGERDEKAGFSIGWYKGVCSQWLHEWRPALRAALYEVPGQRSNGAPAYL